MPKIALNEAQKDSHRATMDIHLATARRLTQVGDHKSAVVALEMALPHANALADKAIKGNVFGLLNSARAKARKAKEFTKPDYTKPVNMDEFNPA